MPDAERLMAAVRRRDAAAFEALFDAYNRLIFGIALRMLRERVAAEDATQAIFLKIWHAPELFRGGNFAAWLARVTRNHCLDQLRARGPSSALEDLKDVADDSALEDFVFGNLDAALVREAVDALPNEQREAIELGFFGGLSHGEIANRTGAPLGTVKTRIRTGLHRLRSSLGGTVNR